MVRSQSCLIQVVENNDMKQRWIPLLRETFSRVHAILQPALSVDWSVGRSVGRSVVWLVTLHFFLGFYFFDLTAPAQMVW